MSRFHKLSVLAAIALAAGPAWAQNCGGTGLSMTKLNIENKIVNEYTCVGGGGYNGGGGGNYANGAGAGGGGGSSFLSALATHAGTNIGANPGNGYVTITYLSGSTPAPEPSSVMLLGAGLLGVAGAMATRRRRTES